MRITIHGIRNCDTMKKARAWLEAEGIAHAFHDYRAQGITRAQLEAWAGKVGWAKLLNRAGTTFRKLPEADTQALDEGRAIELMLAQPAMIKRPVLELDHDVVVGFSPEQYRLALRAADAGGSALPSL